MSANGAIANGTIPELPILSSKAPKMTFPTQRITTEQHPNLMPTDNPSPERFEDYTQLWTSVHNRVHALLLTLVQDPEAARDLTQEVSVVLWRKFDDYQEGSNFFAWAAQVARFHAMNWRRHHSRRGIPLSDGLLDKLATEAEIFAGDYDVRVAALRKCLVPRSREESSYSPRSILQSASEQIALVWQRYPTVVASELYAVR